MIALRAVAIAVLGLALASPALAHEPTRPLHGPAAPPPPVARLPGTLAEIGGGDFSLIDHTGATRRGADFRGSLMLVYFGYTECPYTCGTALNAISGALDELGADAGSVAPLFISVDPEHDTPERIARHLANFHPAIIGLTGTKQGIAQVLTDFHTAAAPAGDPGAFKRLIDHTPMIYLLGPDGGPLTLLPPIVPPERMAAIIRGYME